MPLGICAERRAQMKTVQKTSKAERRRLIKAGVGLAIAISALVALALLNTTHYTERIAAKPTGGRVQEAVVTIDKGEEVPGIDWDYWKSINPDIAAWITIPGTPIDNPIVQAYSEDPTHYLNYDVYDNYNYYGCLYIDAKSNIEAMNTIIFGHNMGYFDETMFTTLTYYLDPNYLSEHQEVIIQTPDEVYRLKVRAADEISPYGFEKEISFSSKEALQEFYLECFEGAYSKCDDPEVEEVEHLFTLITCDSGGATRAIVYVG